MSENSTIVMNTLVNKINEDIKKAAEYALENNLNVEDYYIGCLEEWVPSDNCLGSDDWLQSDC